MNAFVYQMQGALCGTQSSFVQGTWASKLSEWEKKPTLSPPRSSFCPPHTDMFAKSPSEEDEARMPKNANALSGDGDGGGIRLYVNQVFFSVVAAATLPLSHRDTLSFLLSQKQFFSIGDL